MHCGEVAHRIVIVACLVALSVGYGYQPLQRVVLVAGGVAVGVGYGGYLPALCVGKGTGVAQGAGYFLHLAQGVVVVGSCIAQGVGGAGYSPVPVVLPAVLSAVTLPVGRVTADNRFGFPPLC